MKAFILNCTLKPSPALSNTEVLADVLRQELNQLDVQAEIFRLADFHVAPGVSSDEGIGDEWPQLRQKILDADIFIMASPTWVGRMSSMAMKAIERMDAMLSEKDDDGRPVAFNHVAGFIATGNEDGAKHVIGEMIASLVELGFTVPGQAWTYWNNGASMGSEYVESDDEQGKQRAESNAKLAAHVLVATAQALAAKPISPPPS